MKTKPILFQGDMVRANMDGSKTQTRRVMKPQPPHRANLLRVEGGAAYFCDGDHPKNHHCEEHEYSVACPYGQPGDLLWVRETFCVSEKAGRVRYKATDGEALKYENYKPSIHMPRWASRLTLEVTDVRVERVQDISEADAEAEGAPETACLVDDQPTASAIAGFMNIWKSINGDGSWYANPWVWVIEFRAIHDNVDNVLRQREAA